ncbi:hypothetical protein ACFSCV_01670 [Methylopila henanensis]|uniref:Uncharacterized protein n=1 Tax=Methylopila henanensis TaxID=873516 RepID=A0ABW4K0T3_9HYPH
MALIVALRALVLARHLEVLVAVEIVEQGDEPLDLVFDGEARERSAVARRAV